MHDDVSDAVRVRLFDADRRDRRLEPEEALKAEPSERQLLWIDVGRDLPEELHAAIVDRFELDPTTAKALADPGDRPHVALHGRYFHIRVAAEPPADRPQAASWLDVIAGPNVVISRHRDSLRFLEAMDERIAADTTIGQLDSSEFVASVLDAVVTSYLETVDGIEDDVDELDAKALGRERFDDLFEELVVMRRRIGRLRRLLAAHRELFAAVGRRDFAEGTAAADPEAFQAVAGRFEAALASVEETREVVLGSFDVLMTRTSQRTNDVMRVLTVATVLAVPATLIASFLGMNVVTPLPGDQPWAFWVTVIFVGAIEVAMVALARIRGWL